MDVLFGAGPFMTGTDILKFFDMEDHVYGGDLVIGDYSETIAGASITNVLQILILPSRLWLMIK